MADLMKLKELESIRQEAGETVFSYLCRIRVAAAQTEVMKFGTCSKKTHPDLTLEECEEGPSDEPATELSWPCAKGVGWDTLTRDSTLHYWLRLIKSGQLRFWNFVVCFKGKCYFHFLMC